MTAPYPAGVTHSDFFLPEPSYRCWECMEDFSEPDECPNCGKPLVLDEPVYEDEDTYDRVNER